MSATKTTKKAPRKKAPAKRKHATKVVANAAAKPKMPKAEKKASALDARVLGESKQPMTTRAIIEAMALGLPEESRRQDARPDVIFSHRRRDPQEGEGSAFKKAEKGKFTLRAEG